MATTSLRPNRRHTLAAGLAWLLPAGAYATQRPLPALAAQAQPQPQPAVAALEALEKQTGGRLGVALLNTANGALAGHRMEERFAMCSTFKLPLAALVLRQIDQGHLQARQWVPYTSADIVAHAPVARAQLSRGGMTVLAAAEAAQTTSDNTAANLLLGLLGGPAGFTAQWREAGDSVTRLDRLEPQMNLVLPGDPRDTTTPAAMAQAMAKWLTGDLLAPASKALLIQWMVATRTGSKRLRAGLPRAWRAGDKTGTAMAEGMTDRYNDVAIAWPAAGSAPVFISAYFETAVSHGGQMRDQDQAVLAEVGRIAARWVVGR